MSLTRLLRQSSSRFLKRLLNSGHCQLRHDGQVLGTVLGGIIRTVFDVLEGLIMGTVSKGPMSNLMRWR